MKKNSSLFIILFIGGIILLVENVFGLLTTLRNPEIYSERNVTFPNDINLTEDQVYSVINSDRTDLKAYVTKVTMAVNNGIADYWDEEGAEKYNLRIPFHENYILFMGSFIMPEKFHLYEFTDYKRGLERGVGMCSQHAIILSEVLYEKGIKSKIIGLSGHVVATAQVDKKADEWWVLDPGDGVVIPFDLETIEKNPQIIKPYYSDAGYDEQTISKLIEHYGAEGNVVSSGYGIGDYAKVTNYLEQASYILIWVIPILLIFPYVYSRSKNKAER